MIKSDVLPWVQANYFGLHALAAELKAMQEREEKKELVNLKKENVVLEAAELLLKQIQRIERGRAEELRKEQLYWKKEKIALEIAFRHYLYKSKYDDVNLDCPLEDSQGDKFGAHNLVSELKTLAR